MDSCVLDIVFLQNEEKSIFVKKIVISGITSSLKTYTKEIVFSYPENKLFEGEDSDFTTFGNLELKKKEQDLIKTLNTFNTILVNSEKKKQFLVNYTNKRIINFKAD